MKTLRLFARDIRNGIAARWYLLFIPVFFAAAQARELHLLIENLNSGNGLFTNGTVADYIMFVMKGMQAFYFDPKEYFSIPIYWFAFQIGLAYMVAYYAYDDFVVNGKVVFIATGSRNRWWISKFLCCIMIVVLYFAVCIATIYAMTAIYGADMSLEPTISLSMRLYKVSSAGLNVAEIVLLTVILPMLVSLAISQIQMLACFIITPVISFAAVCAVYVLSAYYTAWNLVGNYTMWQRTSYIADNGVNPMSGVVISVGMLLISFVGGLMYFDKKDIL